MHKKSRCVLVFFLDAWRYDDITPEHTPYLSSLAENGVSGPMETILGFTGIAATMFAGCYPCKHGVWTQYKQSKENSPFDWIGPFSGQIEKVDGLLRNRGPRLLRKGFGLTILQLARFRSGMTYYPGVHRIPYTYLPKLDFSIRKRIQDEKVLDGTPTLFDILIEKGKKYSTIDYPLLGSDNAVLQKALRIRDPPELIYIRFMDLDPTSHYYGLGSLQRSKKLRDTDDAVKAIVEHFKKLGYDPFSVIFADHGMVEVTRTVNVLSLLKGVEGVGAHDFMMFLDSTMARFWGNESTISEIGRRLGTADFGKVLSAKDLQNYNAPLDSNYGDLVFLANPGTVFVPNFFEDSPGVKAMHGYDPSIPEQLTIFVLSHSSLKPRKLQRVKLVDILPTILEILEISPPKQCVGKSHIS